MALQSPQTKWQPLARYLRAQQELANSLYTEHNMAIKQSWELGNLAIKSSDIGRHELKQFWDFDFLCACYPSMHRHWIY